MGSEEAFLGVTIWFGELLEVLRLLRQEVSLIPAQFGSVLMLEELRWGLNQVMTL